MQVKHIILDVDGVLTDGSLTYGPDGECQKIFNVKDGMGIHLVQQAGIQVSILSNGRAKDAVEARMRKLGITNYHIGSGNKGDILSNWIVEHNWDKEGIVYMGDDVNDLSVKPFVDLFCCPIDAEEEVKSKADWISKRPGGKGAVRDLCNFVLETMHV